MDSDLLISSRFIDAHPVDAARILEPMPVEDTAYFLEEVSPRLAAAVMGLMDSMTAARCLELVAAKKATEIVANLPQQISPLLLRRCDERTRQVILETMPHEVAKPLRSVLDFAEGTAGALMDPRVFTLFEDGYVREALRHMRKRPKHLIYYVYVLNRDQVFTGYTDLRELMLADPGLQISSVMRTDMGHLSPRLNRAAILDHPDWHRFHALPVLNEKGVFLGALGYQTLRRLEHEENQGPRAESAREAGTALAELYQIGVAGLLKWVATTAGSSKEGGR
jgi:Mg/Co/Ni transporter MgtE